MALASYWGVHKITYSAWQVWNHSVSARSLVASGQDRLKCKARVAYVRYILASASTDKQPEATSKLALREPLEVALNASL